MKHKIPIPPGPAPTMADLTKDALATVNAEARCEMLGLDPDAARIFAALEVTWHPMARVLLESQLDRLIEAAILAKTCEALR